MSVSSFVETIAQDLGYAGRGFRRAPAFTLTAVVAVALGTGAGTAVFSIVDRVLFRSLPYSEDSALVSVGMTAPIADQEFLLGSDYIEWRARQTPFAGFATMSGVSNCDLTEQHPLRMSCARVDATLLPTLGVQPFLGRNFTAEEDRPNGPRAAILSCGLWRSRFAGDSGVVGKTMSIDGVPSIIVGVLPADFELPDLEPADVLVPQALDIAQQSRPNTGSILRAFGRLKPGVTAQQAQAALQPLFADSLQYVPPRFQKEVKLKVRSLRDRQVHDARLTSWLLLGSVLAVLLIACANVANLLLARNAGRQRELAVRSALGATRLRLARQAVTESLLLGTIGGMSGFAMAWLLLRFFVGMAPESIPHIRQAGLDMRVLCFSLAVSLCSGLLFGLAPALQLPRAELLGGGHTVYTPRSFLRQMLVTTQIAVSLVLLTCATMLSRSLWNLERVPLGMGIDTHQVTTASVVLGQQLSRDPAQRWSFFESLESRLRGIPGSMAIADSLPLSPSHSTLLATVAVESHPLPEKGTGGTVVWRLVSPGYFYALNIPILRGRGFTEDDRSSAENPIIISESLARLLFPQEEALGKRIEPNLTPPWFTVIGVAGDVRNTSLAGPSAPEYYFVRKHAADYGLGNRGTYDGARYASVVVRSPLGQPAIADWLRTEIAALDPTLPVEINTMSLRVRQLERQPRFNAVLLSVFAATGLALALIGLYGVISFLVGQRTREIGVRLALGATPQGIMRLILAQAGRWTVFGIALGMAGSLYVSRSIRALLFEVPPADLVSLAICVISLFLVALLAVSIPSLRAARTDPVLALRHE